MKNVCEDYFGEGSSFQICLTLIRYPLGVAIFLLPWSMKFGGIVAGPIFIALFVVINAYRGHVLSKVAAELTSKGIEAPSGISDWWILENSLGGVRRTSVNCYLVIFSTLQWFSLLGHVSTFLAFAGLSYHQVLPVDGWEGITGDRYYIIVCVIVVVIAHAFSQWVRNILHDTCNECICPTLCSAFVLLLLPTIFAVFFGLPTIVSYSAELAAAKDNLQPTTSVEWDKICLLFAGVVFTTGATPDDITASYGSLRNRIHFPIILIVSAIVTIIIGVGLASSVFLGLGFETCGSITFNLPLGDGTSSALRFISATLALIFVSFRHQIDPGLSNRLSGAEVICDVVFKVIFLGVAGGLAIGIPSYTGLACLFGSLTSFALTFVFPFMSDLLLHMTGGRAPGEDTEKLLDYKGESTSLTGASSSSSRLPRDPMSVGRVIRDILFIALGIAGLIAGLIYTVEFLATELRQSATSDCAFVPDNSTMMYSIQ